MLSYGYSFVSFLLTRGGSSLADYKKKKERTVGAFLLFLYTICVSELTGVDSV